MVRTGMSCGYVFLGRLTLWSGASRGRCRACGARRCWPWLGPRQVPRRWPRGDGRPRACRPAQLRI